MDATRILQRSGSSTTEQMNTLGSGPPPTSENVALLDAYATLFALDDVDKTSSTMVKGLAEKEFITDAKENGIIDLLDSHLAYRKSSTE